MMLTISRGGSKKEEITGEIYRPIQEARTLVWEDSKGGTTPGVPTRSSLCGLRSALRIRLSRPRNYA
jgi:hypothetical protein